MSFERVLARARARYVTGLTATPRRRDGHHPIIHMQLGPVRFAVDPRGEAARRPFSQYAGRLHRLHPGKTEVRLYDYVDRHVPMLLRMFQKRLRG